MSVNNDIYPYGMDYEKFLEYRVNCPVCGELIRYFIPEEKEKFGYRITNTTCHIF